MSEPMKQLAISIFKHVYNTEKALEKRCKSLERAISKLTPEELRGYYEETHKFVMRQEEEGF